MRILYYITYLIIFSIQACESVLLKILNLKLMAFMIQLQATLEKECWRNDENNNDLAAFLDMSLKVSSDQVYTVYWFYWKSIPLLHRLY